MLPVSYFHSKLIRQAVHDKETQVVRREMVFDTRIAQSDDQFFTPSSS